LELTRPSTRRQKNGRARPRHHPEQHGKLEQDASPAIYDGWQGCARGSATRPRSTVESPYLGTWRAGPVGFVATDKPFTAARERERVDSPAADCDRQHVEARHERLSPLAGRIPSGSRTAGRQKGVQVAGFPKTIDKDSGGTDTTSA